MFERVQSLMESGKLTEDLAQEIRQARRDLDELAVSLRRDLSGTQQDLTELKAQFAKLTQDQLAHVQALGDAHRDFTKLQDDFSKELSEFKLAKSRMESKFQDAVQRDLKQYIADLRQNLSGFHDVSKETVVLTKDLRSARAEIDKFNAIAKKLQEKDFDLFKFSKQLEAMNREKLNLLKKIDFLEKLVARERRRK